MVITVKKAKILKEAYNLGFKYERKHHGCAQCVFAAIQDIFGIGDEDVFKAATGLSGGSGGMGDGQCGAYSGGIMAISCKYGRQRREFSDRTKTELANDLCRRLHDRFIREYGSCICNDIQLKIFGRSFKHPMDDKTREDFEKAGGHVDKCPTVIGKAAQWVAEIFLEAEK